MAKLADPDPKYGPSETICRYCPYQATCEARLDLLGGALAVIEGGLDLGRDSHEITPARMLLAYEALAALEARLRHFRTELRATIFRDGPIVADGKQLSLQEASVSEIDPQRAWPVLEAWLTVDEIAKCVKLRKGELIKHVRSKSHEMRSKTTTQAEFEQELDGQSAVTYTTQHRLTLRTVEEE